MAMWRWRHKWCGVFSSQGTPKIVSIPEVGRAWDRFSFTGSEGNSPTDTLTSDFWPPGPWDNKFLLFQLYHPLPTTSPTSQFVGLHHSSPSKVGHRVWLGSSKICVRMTSNWFYLTQFDSIWLSPKVQIITPDPWILKLSMWNFNSEKCTCQR